MGESCDSEQWLGFVAFEAAQVYRLLTQLKAKADQSGRGMAVVGNKRYGALLVLTIRQMLEQQGVRIYTARVSSGTADEYTVPDAFKMPVKLLRQLVTDQPMVAVVDGTMNPALNGYVRYPAAMAGYVNLAAAVNDALGMPSEPSIITDKHIARLRRQESYASLVERLRQNAAPQVTAYSLAFWNPAGLEGVIGVNDVGVYFDTKDGLVDKVLPQADVSRINRPTFLIVTSTSPFLAPEDVGIITPIRYMPAALDDVKWGKIEDLWGRLQQKAMLYLS